MKRILIISDTFIPASKPGDEARPLCVDSIVDLDDNVAGLVIASGRGRAAPEGAKLRDTSDARNKAAAERASATPENLLASAIATAVTAALASQAASASNAAAAPAA